jgi:hypothetical protein
MGDVMGGFGGPPPLFTFAFSAIFILIIGVFLFIIVKGLSTWMSNNAAAVRTDACRIVSKRTRVSGGSGDSSASTWYYITFEFDDGQRMELQVRGSEYGLIAEGDTGEVTYQGTRYHEFRRAHV